MKAPRFALPCQNHPKFEGAILGKGSPVTSDKTGRHHSAHFSAAESADLKPC